MKPFRDSTTPAGPDAALAYLASRAALTRRPPVCMSDHPAVIAALLMPRGVVFTPLEKKRRRDARPWTDGRMDAFITFLRILPSRKP